MTTSAFGKKVHPDGWVSVDPLPSAAELQTFYAELYYQSPQTATYQTAYDDLELRYRDLKCRALLHAIAGQGVRAGRTLLDVGAGEGFFLDAAHRTGFDVTGADFSSFGVQKFFPELTSRLTTGDVFETLQSLGDQGRRFGAISVLNVLEHVIDPEALCRALMRVVEPDGVVAITVPNDYSPLQALLTSTGRISREFWFAPPQHLHYFNAASLVTFCTRMGFTLVDAYADFPIDLFLLHPGSNYVEHPEAGKPAHRARLEHDLLIAEQGLDVYLNLYRAMFRAGIGRDITVLLRVTRG